MRADPAAGGCARGVTKPAAAARWVADTAAAVRRGVTVAVAAAATAAPLATDRGGVFMPTALLVPAALARVGVAAPGDSNARAATLAPLALRAELGGVNTATWVVGRLGVDTTAVDTSLGAFFDGLALNEFSLSFSAASAASISRNRCKEASVPAM